MGNCLNITKMSLVRNMRFTENSPCPETQNKMVSNSKGVEVMLYVRNLLFSALHNYDCVPIHVYIYTHMHTDSSIHYLSGEWSILGPQHSSTTHHCPVCLPAPRPNGQLCSETARGARPTTAAASGGRYLL